MNELSLFSGAGGGLLGTKLLVIFSVNMKTLSFLEEIALISLNKWSSLSIIIKVVFIL